MRSGCEALIYVKGNRDTGTLEIKKISDEHNHPIGPDVFYKKRDTARSQLRMIKPRKKKAFFYLNLTCCRKSRPISRTGI